MLRFLGLHSPGRALTALIFVGTLQVHGYWSNDPVTAFPVASWAFCVIGLVYLGFTLEVLTTTNPHRRIWLWITALAAFIGVLTYELFIAFIAASAVLQLLHLRQRSDEWWRRIAIFLVTVLIPGTYLVLVQVARLSRGSSYTGTEIAVNSGQLPAIALMALLSSLPLSTIKLTLQFFHGNMASISTIAPMIGGLCLLAGLGWRSNSVNEHSGTRRYGEVVAVAASLLTVWVVSTLVIVATPKYQSELAGVLGKVYVNYSSSWIALALVWTLAVAVLTDRFGGKTLHLSILLFLTLGAIHGWANGAQLDVLTRDSSWSSPLLRNLESAPEEEAGRCREVDRLFSMPLPEYYQLEILEGFQMSYSGTWGIPYCDFSAGSQTARPLIRPLVGSYPIEYLPDKRRIMWTDGPEVQLQILNPTRDKMTGQLTIGLAVPACTSIREVNLSDTTLNAGVTTKKVILTTSSPSAKLVLPLSIEPGASTYFGFTQSGPGCKVGPDPRLLWTMLELPALKSP